ncbi:hypothetical protein BAE44_0005908 [Dichanthelium oligosanthes]|uniref:Subtilisin inhibitor 1 n=1 Tax=Dichanthelium oligosanthes TaxID=888268 RepID=A0A1E5W6R1_9POAL|nr:hypothetical protein BAE44_0005908 [Dichanthelium oligosanthes]
MGRGILSPPAAAASASDEGDLKTSWPEVVGWVALNASFKITSDRPDVSTPYYYKVGTDLHTNYGNDSERVVIIFEAGNVVARTPVVG